MRSCRPPPRARPALSRASAPGLLWLCADVLLRSGQPDAYNVFVVGNAERGGAVSADIHQTVTAVLHRRTAGVEESAGQQDDLASSVPALTQAHIDAAFSKTRLSVSEAQRREYNDMYGSRFAVRSCDPVI